MQARRPVNWDLILGDEVPAPVRVAQSAQGELASLLSAFNALPALDDADGIVRRAIELARTLVGLDRVAVFLCEAGSERMLGTWGTSLEGELVDEHHIMFEAPEGVADVFARAETLGQLFTVLDNCPIVVHEKDSSRVVGRGWVACTPIRSARTRIGIMFNDTGVSGTPCDAAKQERAAILCSLLGSALELLPARSPSPSRSRQRAPAIQKALELLDRDPTLGGKELAAALDLSLSRFVRLFKSELGVSLVEYRNRLRIERFHVLAGAGARPENLQAVARAAGFGSYAQFHRVFRATHGTAPSNYLRGR